MIASATRFAAPVTPDNTAKADAWADAAIQSLTPQIYQGFGVVQLMALLLAQHYDLARGKFTSAWLLGASCARMMQMMSLHTFDRTYPADFPSPHRLSPLLSREALRRVAWCTFYLDSMIDGGRYGSQTIEERSFRIQLPCDQESFLSNEQVKTEPLFLGRVNPSNPMEADLPRAPLDMWAYILRAAAARRRVLHFAFRASHQDQSIEHLSTQLSALQADIEEVIAALPRRLHFNTDNVFLHGDRLGTFILLHVLRHNLFIILGRAALLIFSHDPTRRDLVVQARRSRIAHALAISGLVKAGLEKDIIFDPHIGIQSYVALEILLFEPRRLAAVDSSSDPKSPEFIKAIGHLLTVIRHLAGRSEFSKDLYLEAAYRMIKCDFTRLLSQEDLTLIQSHDHNLVGQDVAEYDFRDFRKARAERLAHLSRTSSYHVMHAAPDEVLLDDSIGREMPEMPSAPSPRLDALDVCNTIPRDPVAQVPPTGAPGDPNPSAGVTVEGYGGVRAEWPLGQYIESEDADDLFSSLHWFWSLNESTDNSGSSPLPDAFQSVYL
ncbi:hypothetical protein AbraIFM66950_010008 [Aspergillus brasiliensis]|nr:hypothetical protein AbraIFM66950_010008 [Aspergillus brasiliensis]